MSIALAALFQSSPQIKKVYLDIIRASVSQEGEDYAFTVTTAEDFPDPNHLGHDDTFTLKWFVDIDKNRGTGYGDGNDYNIHLWCSNERAWYAGWLKTVDSNKQEERKIDRDRIVIRIKNNTASLVFPKDYLPSAHFDWWMNTGTSPHKGPSAANNPLTERGTFRVSLSG